MGRVNDPTFWIAIAGLSTTLLAGLGGPWVAERMRRTSTHRQLLLEQRLDVYAELLRVSAKVADNATDWAVRPLDDLDEISDEELDRIVSRARAVSSEEMAGHLKALYTETHKFYRLLFAARTHLHHVQEDSGGVGDGKSIVDRVELAGVADSIRRVATELEATCRKELAR